jgi:hypothetical protein
MRINYWIFSSAMPRVVVMWWLASRSTRETEDSDFCIIVGLERLAKQLHPHLQTMLARADEVNGGVMAASHCHSWWRWQSETLSVSLTTDYTMTVLILVCFGLAGTERTGLQSTIYSFLWIHCSHWIWFPVATADVLYPSSHQLCGQRICSGCSRLQPLPSI